MNQQQDDLARHEMWKRLGCNSKSARYAHAAMFNMKPYQLNPTTQDILTAMHKYDEICPIDLAPLCIPTVMKASVDYAYAQVQTALSNPPIKKGNEMYDDFDDCECMNAPAKSDETKKREYLARRIYNTADILRSKLMKQFYMQDDYAPTTFQELLDRLAAGKYAISDEQKKKKQYYVGDLFRNLQWRDPAHPADETGYELATEALEKEHTRVMDLAKIGDIDEALKAVYAFESWTYTA